MDKLENSRDCHAENKRPQFGNRFLTDESNVFQHNAWDNVKWDEKLEATARERVAQNASEFVSSELQDKYERDADKFWDEFYSVHQNRFFKDRHWLFTEFPELDEPIVERSEDHSQAYPGSLAGRRILEIGCGVGNTVFPILERNRDPKLFVYSCDFSPLAVSLVQENIDYDPSRCHAFVCDISDTWTVPFPERSLDIAILVFVLSTIHPDKMSVVVEQLEKYLKPGGLVLFRDYGKYDMAQLRFKKGKCLAEDFYVRGDGTRVYFFTQDHVDRLFTSRGFVREQNSVDRRLQVNRGKMLTMYRVWIQAKYRKPS